MGSDYLKNYNQFKSAYEAFLPNCEDNFDRPDIILAECKKMMNNEIDNVAHRAKREIENLIFPNNPNSERFIKSVYNDYLWLKKQAQSNIEANNLYSVKIMPKHEVREYLDVVQIFYNFYDFFIEKSAINSIIERPREIKAETKEKHTSNIEYNHNHFNAECYNLFLHLIEKYEKRGKVKYINIWFFLKHHIDKDTYVFDMIQDDYRKLIKTKYQTEIKKFAKAKISFDDKELPKLKSFERRLSKQVENT